MTVFNEDDVQAVLMRELTTNEQQWFDRLAEFTQAEVENRLPGFRIEPDEEAVDVVAYDSELWTPKYPVRSITSVALGAGVFTASTYTHTEHGKITLGARSLVNGWEINVVPTLGPAAYTVDYEFGIAADDPRLTGVISVLAGMLARAFRRVAAGGEGVTQESLGSYSVTYEQTERVVLEVVDQEMRSLRQWVRPKAMSVPMTRL